MNNKKILIIVLAISTFSFLIGSAISIWLYHKNISPLWSTNTINVIAEQPLEAEKVKILLSPKDKEGTSELSTYMEEYRVLFDGENKEKMKSKYGENHFLVTYNDTYYYSFSQFKSSNRSWHTYKFHFVEKEGKPFITIDIKGDGSSRYEGYMNAITKVGN